MASSNRRTYGRATWMGDLKPFIGERPLNEVKLPGSHDSATFGITASSKPSPDGSTLIKLLSRLGNAGGDMITLWAKAQGSQIDRQLASGIRYLDLRTAKRGDALWEVHSLYSVDVENALRAVRTFLDQNEGELVILDLQHFYDMGEAEHRQLIGLIERFLGAYTTGLSGLTPTSRVTDFLTAGCRAIVVYQHEAGDPMFWKGQRIASRWPCETSPSDLATFLRKELDRRVSGASDLFVLQGVLGTDDTWGFLELFTEYEEGLKDCAKRTTPKLARWIDGWLAEDATLRPKANIVIADWAVDHAGTFCDGVVNLNIPPR